MKKLSIIALLLVLCINLYSCTNKEREFNDNKTENTIEIENTKNIIDYSNLSKLDLQTDNISIYINGNKITLDSPIYLDKNRYYLCLNEIISLLDGTIDISNNKITSTILSKNFSIDLITNTVTSTEKSFTLKNLINLDNDIYYIDFSDLSNILNLYTKWDKESKTIYCKVDGNNLDNITEYTPSIETLGFLRLEDVALTLQPTQNEYFEKIRIISNYLAKKNVPYHIAWIPRAVYPSQNLDLDPMVLNDFATAEMVYSLDFIVNNKGLIGLHGYTHQSDSEESGIGTEFGYKQSDTNRFRERIEAAIKTAEYLNIPISFFEAPHYSITPEQNKIAEEYFKILYYPFNDYGLSNVKVTSPQLSPYNNSSYYISTPLDYIKFDNVDGSIENLKYCSENKMGSIFYHPVLDFDSIVCSLENNIPTYNYDENSPLKRVINILDDKGFKMSYVNSI